MHDNRKINRAFKKKQKTLFLFIAKWRWNEETYNTISNQIIWNPNVFLSCTFFCWFSFQPADWAPVSTWGTKMRFQFAAWLERGQHNLPLDKSLNFFTVCVDVIIVSANDKKKTEWVSVPCKDIMMWALYKKQFKYKSPTEHFDLSAPLIQSHNISFIFERKRKPETD